ncbi:MAG: hypothetical protein RBT81_09200 [Gammaproteobacteria bacterium]|nr:hypothetical protein [Gammaproteobacteria bacterium]
MRMFFLLLVLANLALWYWHEPVVGWLQGAPPEQVSRPLASDAPPLVLLSERQDAARQDAVSAPPRTEPPASRAQTSVAAPADSMPDAGVSSSASARAPVSTPSRPEPAGQPQPQAPAPASRIASGSCIEIGVWSELAAAETARTKVQGEGAQAEIVTVERQRPAGHWMLTADRYDRAGARETLRRMQGQGLEDIAIVSLDSGWAISLGLFSRTAALERRRAQMLELGYTPEVRERSETRTEYLLRLSPGASAAAQRLADTTPGLELRTVDCFPAQD